MSTVVYIITVWNGDNYDDSRTWNEKAFLDKEKAEEFVKNYNNFIPEPPLSPEEFHKHPELNEDYTYNYDYYLSDKNYNDQRRSQYVASIEELQID